MQVFEDLRAEGHADEVAYNRLIKGYCAADDVKSAKQTLARMKEDGIAANTIGHNSVVNKLASSGDRHGAWEALEALRADGLSEDWHALDPSSTGGRVCWN